MIRNRYYCCRKKAERCNQQILPFCFLLFLLNTLVGLLYILGLFPLVRLKRERERGKDWPPVSVGYLCGPLLFFSSIPFRLYLQIRWWHPSEASAIQTYQFSLTYLFILILPVWLLLESWWSIQEQDWINQSPQYNLQRCCLTWRSFISLLSVLWGCVSDNDYLCTSISAGALNAFRISSGRINPVFSTIPVP